MRIINALSIAALLAGTASAGPKPGLRKKDPWRYAGEDHGIRFYFRPIHHGAIRIKVENGLDMPVDVVYRVKDTDWKKIFTCSLAAGAADSSLRYRPREAEVRYPYFDRIFLERTEGAASVDPAPAAGTAPGRG